MHIDEAARLTLRTEGCLIASLEAVTAAAEVVEVIDDANLLNRRPAFLLVQKGRLISDPLIVRGGFTSSDDVIRYAAAGPAAKARIRARIFADI